MAPVILIRRLLDVQQAGTEASCWKGEIVPLPPRPSRANPSLWALLSLITVYLFRYAGRRLLALRGDAKWFVCYRPHRNAARFDAAGFRAVPNPPGASYADPFLFEHEGRTHLFVEEIVTATSRGHCSACEILPDGSLTPFTTVLQTPYHLSYPCVFKTNDGIFMIPETADRRTVQLHRAAPFPQQWPLEKVLFSDVLFVDTTPFFHEGVWYLFTGTVEEVSGQWLETWLFTADQLEGPWHYHPCNPICSDVRRARPAGHLFYRDGKLIRPGQDCTVRYGYALTLSHVVQLSPTMYEEKLVEVILPDWMPGIFATHTLNTGGGYEVIDATRLPS